MANAGLIKEMILKFQNAEETCVAFSTYDGEKVTDVTYPQFASDILKTAGYFFKNNISHQNISIMAPNSYEWLVTYFAIIASGNTVVLMNQDLPCEILIWQCRKADISMVCSDEETLKSLRDTLGNVRYVSFASLGHEEAATPDMLYQAAPNDTIQMLFTSGTTGQSKAVEHTEYNLSHVMTSYNAHITSMELRRVSIPVPFYHSLGMESAIISLYYGKTVCIGRGIKYLFLDMAALNPMLLVAVPSVVESLAKILKRVDQPEERRKYIGDNLNNILFAGACLKEHVLRILLEKEFTMSVFYGMSELPGASTMCIIDCVEHYRSAGKFTPNTQYRFEDGELMIKSARLMKGYYKDPDETAKVIEDGWIHTGDLGRCDEDGYFFLTGRKKNVIILSNGENVNPEEIEADLGGCLDIIECMVYGDGKGICADIYTSNQESVQTFVKAYNRGTPLYRQVYKVNCVSEPLEKTGSGKIKRKVNIYE